MPDIYCTSLLSLHIACIQGVSGGLFVLLITSTVGECLVVVMSKVMMSLVVADYFDLVTHLHTHTNTIRGGTMHCHALSSKKKKIKIMVTFGISVPFQG